MTVSSKGQIAIPKAVREQLGLRAGTLLQIDVHDHQILLRPLEDWRGLRGIAAGVDLLQARREERRRELNREKRRERSRG